jgi:hypothetical protein
VADDEIAFIPRVIGANLGINFFAPDSDPVLVMNCIIFEPETPEQEQLSHFAGVEGQRVVPLAFHPADLEHMIDQIIEGLIRVRVVIEMTTTWPDKRDEIIRNLLFRWAGHVSDDEGDGD